MALLLVPLATAWLLAERVDGERLLGHYSERALLILLAVCYACAWGIYVVTARPDYRQKLLGATVSTLSAVLTIGLLELPALAGVVDYGHWLSPPESVVFTRLKPWERPSNQFDPELLFVHRPGLRFAGRTQGDMVEWLRIASPVQYHVDLQYDENGFRNRQTPTRADIVAIGDSFVEAGLVADGDLLTSRLAVAFGVDVANLGLGGYGPQQELIVLRRYALPLEPKVVLWFIFEGNDLLDVHRYEEFRQDLSRVRREGSFFERSLSLNGLRTLSWLLTPPTTRDSQEAVRRSCVFRAREDAYAVSPPKLYFAYAGAELTPKDLQGLEVLQDSVEAGAAMTRERNARFLLLFIPTKYRVHGDYCEFPEGAYGRSWIKNDLPQRLADWSRDADLDFLDLTSHLQHAASEGNLTYFPDDGHWNAEGHQVVATAIADSLEQRGWITRARTP